MIAYMVNSYDPEKKIGYVENLGVHPRYRRKGVATFMAFESMNYFITKDIEKLRADVYYLNKPSLNFLNFFGFVEVDRYIL